MLSYIRTEDGFLTAMHDVAPVDGDVHRVAIFNPGSNRNQVSRLRLVNPTDGTAAVTIRGADDTGLPGTGEVSLTLDAGTATEITAEALESGGRGFEGMLGDGSGKWRLEVESEQAIVAMSLLESPTDHLTNLSTVPVGTGRRGACGAVVSQGGRRVGPPGLRAGDQPFRYRGRGPHQGLRRDGAGLRTDHARHRRERGGALQLGRSGTGRQRQGPVGRRGRWRGRLAA